MGPDWDIGEAGGPGGDHQRTREGDEGAGPSSKKGPVRKRTKTGCQTCRRRRIKCDEGKPICNNCIKAKRFCEGYSQRVVFKEPLGFAGMPFGPTHYPGPPPQGFHREQQLSGAQQRGNTQPLLAPRPPPGGQFPPLGLRPHIQAYCRGGENPISGHPVHDGRQSEPTYIYDDLNEPVVVPKPVDNYAQLQWSHPPNTDSQLADGKATDLSPIQGLLDVAPQNELHEVQRSLNEQYNQGAVQYEPLKEWDFETYRQDESMDESDDELPADNSVLQLKGPQAGSFVSGLLRDPHDPHETLPRYFMASGSSLATYDPEPSQSPLNDEQIRAVFSHFIRVTGPSISLYERHVCDAEKFMEGQEVMPQRRHIWASTFPILSFSHPALLQAILAMASLQIARLEGNRPMASLKHYHLALRRIARNVGRPIRRAQPANLAATLLLGYYEVWNSDHEKWCQHLLGARLIMKDIPFASMSKAVLARRTRERYQREQLRAHAQFNDQSGFIDDSDPEFLYRDWDLIDTSLLQIISGRPISFIDHGRTTADETFYTFPRQPVTDKDVETYETLSDLYWWYCKMDNYQSILGGQKLFMDYDKWMACPPRAPIGRLDAIYGTFDHLMLLLARMTNFNASDQARKKKALSMSTHGPKAPPPGAFPGLVPTTGNVPLPAGFSPPRDISPAEEEVPEIEPDFETQTAAAHIEWASILQAFEAFKNALGPDFVPLGADVYQPLNTPFGPSRHYRTYSVAGIWLNYYMGLIMLYRAHPSMPPIAMMAAGLQAPATAEYAMEIGRISIGLEEDTSLISVVSTLGAAGLIESAFPLFVAAVQYREDDQRKWLIRRLHDIARLTGWESARQIAMGSESAWIRAYELNRGPPYKREPEMNHVAKSLPSELLRSLGARISEIDGETQERKGKMKEVENPHYAMGLLLVEQDFEKLELQEKK